MKLAEDESLNSTKISICIATAMKLDESESLDSTILPRITLLFMCFDHCMTADKTGSVAPFLCLL